MKKFALLLSALLVAGAAYASQATTSNKSQSTKTHAAKSATSAAKTHTVEAEVVSADATAKTLTIKAEGGDKTVPVEGAAASHLKSLKAGEKVKLTCRDNEKGEHQAITHIAVEKTPAKK